MTDQIEKEKNLPTERPKIETGLTVTGGLIPKDFDGLYRFCTILAASGLMPKGLEKVEAVFVAVQMGLEVGLSPMQAVQNIAPINGRPAIWGDAVLGLVRASGLLVTFSESTEGTYPNDDFKAVCIGQRKGEGTTIVREFSIADAKQAGLWCQGTHNEKLKYTPWYKYPKRMLQMRARSWALRDGFGDVLKGLRVAEEILDYDIDLARTSGGTYSVNDAETSDLSKKIKEAKKEDVPRYGSKEYARKMVEKSEGLEKKPPTENDESEPSETEILETVEENQEEPEQQKTEEDSIKTNTPAPNEIVDLDAFRDEWAKLTQRTSKAGPSFSTYFYSNRSKFETASPELQAEAEAKWNKLYPATPWKITSKPKDDKKSKMIDAIKSFFESEAVERALSYQHQDSLDDCSFETLEMIYGYLQKSESEDLA